MKDGLDAAPELIDVTTECPQQYSTRKGLLDLLMPAATYLSVSGEGAPGGAAFGEAIQVLFSIAFTGKFTLKAQGIMDFKVLPLECCWGNFDHAAVPRERWAWALQIQVPRQFTRDHVELARRVIRERRGVEVPAPELATVQGGRCLQLLHVGPYEGLRETYGRLELAAAELGLEADCGRSREIYLSDPRRCRPERLKTIVRIGV